jgi:type IV pilus assembly protein PilQ
MGRAYEDDVQSYRWSFGVRRSAILCLLALAGLILVWVPWGHGEGETPEYTGFPISLNLREAEVVTVLHLIAQETGINLVVADDVRGKVDVHLLNVPWDQALDEVLRSRDLVKRHVGNVLHVYTLEGLKRELEIKELLRGDARKALEARQKAREVQANIRAEEEMAKPLISRTFPVRYAKVLELQKNLLPHLSRDAKGQPRGSIEVNEFSNILVVRDIAPVMEQIGEILTGLDRPLRQILIEARIVEVNTDAVRDLGIQWGGQFRSESGGDVNQIGGARGFSPSSTSLNTITSIAERAFAVNVPAAEPVLALGVTLGKLMEGLILDVQLTALENQGRVHILSRPRIVTSDNFEAVIKRGEDIPYILRRQAEEVPDVQFKEAQLQLRVRPHVIGEERVALDIVIHNDARTDEVVLAEGSQFPIIARQEVSTRALVNDGETVVLGGIIRQEKRRREIGVPYLMDIPGLSWLFKRRVKNEDVRELLIFITPRILEGEGG